MSTENVAAIVDPELERMAEAALATLAARFPGHDLTRVRGFIEHATGRTTPVFHEHQSSNAPPLHFPGLPADPFFDVALFPERTELELAFDDVRREVADAFSTTVEASVYESGATPRWPQWKKVTFYAGGPHARQDALCDAFPLTSGLVDRIVAGYRDFLTAGLLIQDGKMAITPHVDWFNVYVSLWLPIIVPPGCGLEVGGQRRVLEAGRCIAFENTYFHSSWNDSDEPRIVLAFYRLSPRLTPTEVEAFIHLKDRYGDQLFSRPRR
jgi:hypothetical protein